METHTVVYNIQLEAPAMPPQEMLDSSASGRITLVLGNAYPVDTCRPPSYVPISIVVPSDPQRKQPGQNNQYLTTLSLRSLSVLQHGDYMSSMIILCSDGYCSTLLACSDNASSQ